MTFTEADLDGKETIKINELGQKITSTGYLIPIDYSNSGAVSDFIVKAEDLLEKYTEYNKFAHEFKFKKLDVYGTIDEPYFVSKYIYKYIFPDKDNHKDHIKKFGTTPDVYGNYLIKVNTKNYQKNKDKNKDSKPYHYKNQTGVNLVNEMGLMKALFMAKTKFAITFQKLILEFLRNIRKNHSDIWKKELNLACEKVDRLEQSNFYNNNLSLKLNTLDNFFDSEPVIGSDEQKELIILRTLHMKPVSVYLVDEDYVKKASSKKKPVRKRKIPRKKGNQIFDDMSDSEEEADGYSSDATVSIIEEIEDDADDDLYEVPYNCMSIQSLKNEYADDDLYFHIQTMGSKTDKPHDKYHKVFDLYLQNTNHYKSLMKAITDKDSITSVKTVFKTSYNTIMDSKARIFVESHSDLFKSLRGAKYKTF